MSQASIIPMYRRGGPVWTAISWLFHPLFVPVYVLWILAFAHPTLFAGFSDEQRWRTLIITAINLVFFPLLAVALLRGLKFIDSIYMHTQKDRIIPFIAYGIFSFWGYTVFKNQVEYPREWPAFLLGIFLAASAALLANIYLKVSMHAMAMGGMISFFLLMAYSGNFPLPWILAVIILVGGMVCTARLQLAAHGSLEVGVGFGIGVLAQLVAWYYTFNF